MNKIKFSVLWAGVVALILWLVSIFIPITPLITVLFLAITVGAGVYGGALRSKPAPETFKAEWSAEVNGKNWKLNWDWKDWGGLILLILVVAALVKGVNPVDLINIIGPFFSGGK